MRDTGWTNNGNCLWERYIDNDQGDRILGAYYTIPVVAGGTSYAHGFRIGHGWQRIGTIGGTDPDNARCMAVLFLLQNWPPAFPIPEDINTADQIGDLARYLFRVFGDDRITVAEELPGVVADVFGNEATPGKVRDVFRRYIEHVRMVGSVAP